MIQPDEDVKPDDVIHTTTVREVVVELGMVEILRHVQQEPGKVADNVEEDDGTEGPGRVGQKSPVLRYLVLA